MYMACISYHDEVIKLFNIQNKYSGAGCYRFLDKEAKTIYVGISKNIHRRLFSQHFKTNGNGHLPSHCYGSVCKIEIIRLKDYAQCLALEQYLIDKYRPQYNVKDKSKDIFNKTKFDNLEYFEGLENWKLYYTFKEYDFNKVQVSKKQHTLAYIATVAVFIFALVYMFMEVL